jgi:putative membrane-bound dehydrogenase-like protein
MAWDHRGRLWIAESTDYPNNLQPPGTGNDRIKICEDTDGDGRADKFTVFADKLSIPTSITFSNGGVIIFSAPNTVFLKDTDGDDRADERRVLFTGWGTRDTHAGPSNLHYGLDNWIWGIVGYSGFAGTVGGESFRFAQGFFRFKPDGSKLEFLRNTSNNSWGVSFTEEGLVFGSTANGCPSVYLPIPNRYYESVRGWSSSVLASIAASNRFYPLTDKVRQVDWHGGFTAAAGHAIYTARTYPRDYWNRAAFVTEPTGHLAATFLLERNGSDFVSNNSWNLVASDDEWTSPICAEVGPDGHVWVIDWYSYIVQHNPTPQGFQTGAGNAYVTPLRDKTHGRIYRIFYTEAKPQNRMALDPGNGEQLVAALRNDNMFWRTHAQRLLVERGAKDVVPSLVAMVNDRSVDTLGLNPGAIHALAVLRGLGLLDVETSEVTAAAVSALSHPSAGVRRNALEVLPRTEASARAILSAKVLQDADAQVRLAAFLALSEMPPSDHTAGVIVEELLAGHTERDRWLNDAATTAAAANANDVLRRLTTTKPEILSRLLRGPSPAFESLVARVAEHYARGVPAESVGALVATLGDAHPRVTELIAAGLARGWPKEKPAKLTDADEQAIIALLPKLPPASRGPLVSLGSRWGGKALEKHTAEISSSFFSIVKDDKAGDDSRASAARQLVEFRPGDVEVVKTLLALVNPRTSPDLAVAFVSAAAKSDATETGTALVDSLPSLTPTARVEAVRTLIGRESWAPAFMTAVEQGKIQLAELSLDQKQALTAHPNRTIARRARELLARGGGLPDADRQKVIDELSPLVLKSGDPSRGKVIFTQQCAKCHRYNNEGGKVGPDLSGMAAHPRSELLVHILDPSRSVEGNFLQYSLVTTEGRILTGLLSSETKTAVELIDAEGKKQTVLRQDIDELAATKKSLMPEGFEKQVNAEGLADLLAFLTQRGKYMPLDLRKVATANSTRGMFQDRNSTAERLVFPDWSPKTFEGVPFALVDPTEGDIPNVVMLHGPMGPFAPTMPRSVTLPCNSPAKAIHFLSGVSGWGAVGRGAEPTVSMVVRLNYADKATEDFPLRNGVEFADYIRRIDVPGSKFAFALGNSQIRYFSITPGRTDPIESIELRKGSDDTAPVVMAVTVETAG